MNLSTCLLLLATTVPSPSAAPAGGTMLHVAWRPLSPDAPRGSFGASIRHVWRLGDKYIRVEEAADPEQRIHGLMVIAEPDVWLVNLYDKTGQHIVDPGPTFVAHHPVFPAESSSAVRGLEIGSEMAFFERAHARVLPERTLDGIPCLVRRIQVDGRTLTLYVTKRGSRPFQVDLKGGPRPYSIRYEMYDTGLAPDLSRFEPPRGIALREAKSP